MSSNLILYTKIALASNKSLSTQSTLCNVGFGQSTFSILSPSVIRTIFEVFHVGATKYDGGKGTASLLLLRLLLLHLLHDHGQPALGLWLTFGIGHRHGLHKAAVVGELGGEIAANVFHLELLR